MQLSKQYIDQILSNEPLRFNNSLLDLPEKVIQFGTGVLLRGLPDYFIDKANRKGKFNGRIVVVKSTAGNTEDFRKQDNLYTVLERGIENDVKIEQDIINSSISRVLQASSDWPEILACARDPEIGIVISNTTEVGIVLSTDRINEGVPASFPGKLLAFLYERFGAFNGSNDCGMVIIPTELITDNAKKLHSILQELAILNSLSSEFIKWLNTANHFCNSLVDRIVPGKLPEFERIEVEKSLGYTDDLMIMAESFRLWAIESPDDAVNRRLSFSEADEAVIITADIEKYRELKLRLLNGTHTFSCGLAFLAGFKTVRSAMEDEKMSTLIRSLMIDEAVEALSTQNISYGEAYKFANRVLDRFRNPYLNHRWHSITLNFTSKMRMRNIPLLRWYHNKYNKPPELMSLGFAAYLLFMKCSRGEDGRFYGMSNGESYLVDDEKAAYFSAKWDSVGVDKLANDILADEELWGMDLNLLPGFSESVTGKLNFLINAGASEALIGASQNYNSIK